MCEILRRACCWRSHRIHRTGTLVTTGDTTSDEDTVLWLNRTNKVTVPLPKQLVGQLIESVDESVRVDCRFLPEYLPLKGLYVLLSQNRIATHSAITCETAALVILLYCAKLLVYTHSSGIASILMRGYLLWPTEDAVVEVFNDVLMMDSEHIQFYRELAGVDSAQDLISLLENLQGRPWPLAAGPILMRIGNAICLDLSAACNSIESRLEFPKVEGDVGNARGTHFEDAVQAVIDNSKWNPSSPIHSLRQRTLRLHGQDLTDIDAIGEKNGALLIVSCKSVIYSGLYDAGDYKTVRNISTHVRDSLIEWNEIRETLISNPIGDNYDISACNRIISVVCTPHVAFADSKTMFSTSEKGLPSVASVAELAMWLDT